MRRPLIGLLCAAFVALAAARLAAAANERAPAHLLIDAQEWSLWPSRSSLPAGAVDVELWNRGQDAHDTWIRPVTWPCRSFRIRRSWGSWPRFHSSTSTGPAGTVVRDGHSDHSCA